MPLRSVPFFSADPVVSAPGDDQPISRALRTEGADAPRSTSTGYVMNVGDTFNGTLSSAGDADWVRVTLQPGTYAISLNGRGANGVLDTYLRVMDGAGNQVAYNDDANGLYSSLVLNVTSTTTYYLEAASYSDGYSGDYSLSVSETSLGDEWTMDEIADQLSDGYWNSQGGSRRAFYVEQGGVLNVDLSALTPAGRRLADMALEVWEQVLGITFNRNPGNGAAIHISFDDSQPGAYSTSQVFSGQIISSHVNVGVDWLTMSGTGFNTYSYQTYIHEIGHALGLGHAGNYNGNAVYGIDNDYANDSWQASIMSYFSQTDNTYVNASYAIVASAMMADILAMQELYGMTGIRSGNNTYGERSNAGASYSTIASMLNNPNTRDDITFTIFDQGGTDLLELSSDPNDQLIRLGPGLSSNAYGLVGNVSIAEGTVIERYRAGRGDDMVVGNGASNTIWGGNGDDTIRGGRGHDIMLGEAGVDVMIGGAGNDTYYATPADTVTELAGEGVDTVRSTVSYRLGPNVENLILFSNNVAHGYGNNASNEVTGNGAGNRLYGNGGNDTLNGQGGNDTLVGGAGADWLIGGSGNDVMQGGAGNDYYVVQNSGDRVGEAAGGGVDTVRSTVSFRLGANVENLYLLSNAALDGYGSALNNRMVGNGGRNVLRGLDGNDTLNGQGGNDTLLGNDGSDRLIGGTGYDVLRGGNGNDYYTWDGQDRIIEEAGGGIDTVYTAQSMVLMVRVENLIMTGTAAQNGYGNGWNNRITGNNAANILDGRDGNDTLIGRGGADHFVFREGRDIIADFQNNVDTVRIDDALWGGGARTIAQVLDMAEVVGGNTVFDFGNGNTLTLNGLTNISALQDDILII